MLSLTVRQLILYSVHTNVQICIKREMERGDSQQCKHSIEARSLLIEERAFCFWLSPIAVPGLTILAGKFLVSESDLCDQRWEMMHSAASKPYLLPQLVDRRMCSQNTVH